MPTYHFDANDPPNYTGFALDCLADAKNPAIRNVGQTLSDHALKEFWYFTEWAVKVTDRHGLELFHLPFFATDVLRGRNFLRGG